MDLWTYGLSRARHSRRRRRAAHGAAGGCRTATATRRDGLLFGEVLRAEPAHRGDERRGVAGEVEREAIGAALVTPRQRVRRPAAAPATPRRPPARSSGRPAASVTAPQAEHAARTPRARDPRRRSRHDDQRLRTRSPLQMSPCTWCAELVRQHHLDLVVRVLAPASCRRRGCAACGRARPAPRWPSRLVAEPPLVGADHARARRARRATRAARAALAVERLERVEERQQQHRREVGQADDARRRTRRRRPATTSRARADRSRRQQQRRPRASSSAERRRPST